MSVLSHAWRSCFVGVGRTALSVDVDDAAAVLCGSSPSCLAHSDSCPLACSRACRYSTRVSSPTVCTQDAHMQDKQDCQRQAVIRQVHRRSETCTATSGPGAIQYVVEAIKSVPSTYAVRYSCSEGQAETNDGTVDPRHLHIRRSPLIAYQINHTAAEARI